MIDSRVVRTIWWGTAHQISFVHFVTWAFKIYILRMDPYIILPVYSIQHYDQVCQLLAAGRWFSPGTPFLPPIKLTATIQLKYC